VTEAPALLQVYGWLNSPATREELAQPTAATQKKLRRWLQKAADQGGGDPTLIRLADEVSAVRHTSDAFQDAVAMVRMHIPLHFRGEYGAKLALRDPPTGRPILGHPGTAAAVADFLRQRDTLDAAARVALLERIHPPRRTELLACGTCHRQQEALVDLQAVGYPPGRVEALREGWIFRAIEHISDGRPLYLPEFVLPSGASESQPAPSTDRP
jgi:hypothetical protein